MEWGDSFVRVGVEFTSNSVFVDWVFTVVSDLFPLESSGVFRDSTLISIGVTLGVSIRDFPSTGALVVSVDFSLCDGLLILGDSLGDVLPGDFEINFKWSSLLLDDLSWCGLGIFDLVSPPFVFSPGLGIPEGLGIPDLLEDLVSLSFGVFLEAELPDLPPVDVWFEEGEGCGEVFSLVNLGGWSLEGVLFEPLFSPLEWEEGVEGAEWEEGVKGVEWADEGEVGLEVVLIFFFLKNWLKRKFFF